MLGWNLSALQFVELWKQTFLVLKTLSGCQFKLFDHNLLVIINNICVTHALCKVTGILPDVLASLNLTCPLSLSFFFLFVCVFVPSFLGVFCVLSSFLSCLLFVLYCPVGWKMFSTLTTCTSALPHAQDSTGLSGRSSAQRVEFALLVSRTLSSTCSSTLVRASASALN